MKTRKWIWFNGGAAVIVFLAMALSVAKAEEKKFDWKKIFKPKTEETAEAVEEATPMPEEEASAPEDWSWQPEPVKPVDAAPVMPKTDKYYRLHKIGEGENLHILAAYYYGDARMWTKIHKLNKDKIRNPNMIRKGQVIMIEVEPGWKPRFKLEEFMEKEKKRQEAIAQEPMVKPTIIRETKTVIPTITPLIELEEEVEEGREVEETETTYEIPELEGEEAE